MDILNTTITMLPLVQLVNNEGQLDGVPKNPRLITEAEYRKLVQSLRKDNLTGVEPLKVYKHGEQYVVLGGNQRLRALRELKRAEVPCIIIPADTPAEVLRKVVIHDNSNYGEWDMNDLANEWEESELTAWSVDLPKWEGEPSDEEEVERKRREFEERIKAGELSEEDEYYQEFLDKFRLKKTTDDCYTPTMVYEAIADWVASEYKIKRSNFIRPFYPGGDYKRETYAPDAVVVDNPPFSILAEILTFYNERGVKFFLFAPHLTLFSSSSSSSSSSTALVVGVPVTYENGANVNTSFLTNLEPRTIRLRSCPSLYRAVRDANDANLKSQKAELPRYSYDLHVVTSAMISPYSRLGIDFVVPVSESVCVGSLDAQKASGKAIYGKGYLISDRLKAEREKAERWELSEREKAIIARL